MDKLKKTRDKSMNIMEKSMKTMDTSKNTMEKIMKPVDKLMIMRDCSYKMQQINNFSCKNRGREPGRLKNTKCKNKQFNSAPNEKWANCSDLGVFKSGKSSQNCTRFMRVCYNLPSVMLKVYRTQGFWDFCGETRVLFDISPAMTQTRLTIPR